LLDVPPLLAVARHTPSLSLAKPETLVYPAASMRVFACAMVKLLLPAAGASGVGVLDVVTAGMLGFGFVGGALVCAKAAAVDSARAPARKNGFTEISMILVVQHYNAFSRRAFHHANESGFA
jgi:hypothetical protein